MARELELNGKGFHLHPPSILLVVIGFTRPLSPPNMKHFKVFLSLYLKNLITWKMLSSMEGTFCHHLEDAFIN
jgi:hypothetical protein